MRAFLVRVGIDQAFGHWNAPIDPESGEFVYVPIPEKRGTRFQAGMATGYGPFRAALGAFARGRPGISPASTSLPTALDALDAHLDPDFERLTYGDNGLRRGKGLAELKPGDVVVFFAGLRPITPVAQKLIYAIVGVFRLAEAWRLREVPSSRWAENAHTRKERHGPDDIVLWGSRGSSGRLRRALPIGSYRDGAYRVRPDLLESWGGLSCRDGFIQRSAVPPEFLEPNRFLEWFDSQAPELLAANNPGREVGRKERLILVHLRQPRSTPGESRTDPLYEFGSFGLTGCHRDNLLSDTSASGARLAFVQPGPGAMRVVYVTPPVTVKDHGRRREARWAPAEMPLRYSLGILLVNNQGETELPRIKAMLMGVRRSSWVARVSSAFRSRAAPLPDAAAAELLRAWEDRLRLGGRNRCTKYWQALPRLPSKPDTDRAATYARCLARARGEIDAPALSRELSEGAAPSEATKQGRRRRRRDPC